MKYITNAIERKQLLFHDRLLDLARCVQSAYDKYYNDDGSDLEDLLYVKVVEAIDSVDDKVGEWDGEWFGANP